MRRLSSSLNGFQQLGLIVVIVALMLMVGAFAGSHTNGQTGQVTHNFYNAGTISQIPLFASAFAIMAVGVTMVIITGGIDLSVGSTYAMSGVLTAMLLTKMQLSGPTALLVGFVVCVGIGTLCGLVNGLLITLLGVHPFIITLGTMWVFRGIAFVVTKAQTYNFPSYTVDAVKNHLGLGDEIYPVPIIIMVLIAVFGWLFLTKTVMGRRVFAVGGNIEASRYSGVPIHLTLTSVYTISGMTAGIAAFTMGNYFGASQSNDGYGYELYVIASAVVGGASLAGGKGSAISAMLGAVLIRMLQQSISTLHLDQQYEYIIIGCAIVIAVLLDRLSARISARRLAQMRE